MATNRLLAAVLATAAVIGASPIASAADMPANARVYKAPVAQVYDWTGFYIGLNAGVGLGRDYTGVAFPASPSFEASHLSPQGGLGGGQIGYNWQSGIFVFGVEADIQGAGLRDDRTCLFGCSIFGATGFDQRLDWFGTVRGRVGLANGPVLTYFTAGYAYGGVKTTVTESFIGTTSAFSTDKTRGGWTYGSGVEASLGGNWTGKIEYLYLDLGNRLDGYTLGGLPKTISTDVREHIFRVGLNYRGGGNGAYAPLPAASWTSFYLGGNVGSGMARERSSLAVFFTNEQFNLSPYGFIGGVQAGYNWQAASWVFGVEADIQGSTQRDNKTCVEFCSSATPLFAQYDATLPWLGTVRGRFGYSVGPTLFYATGGFAYGGIKTRITSDIGGPSTVELSRTKGGWTAGAGMETPFTLLDLFGPNWTSKTEYLYVDLGSTSDTFTTTGAGPITSTIRVQEHIFRTGLNYHFNSPVVAKY